MKPHIKNSDDPFKDERYTPKETIDWALKVTNLSEYTLDVAACEEAHWADQWYGDKGTSLISGLLGPWFGDVWCNPPYSDIKPWVEKAWFEHSHRIESPVRSVSMLLPATRTEQAWWQENIEPYRDRPDGILRTFFVPGRIKFRFPEGSDKKPSSAPFPCVLLFWRPIK